MQSTASRSPIVHHSLQPHPPPTHPSNTVAQQIPLQQHAALPTRLTRSPHNPKINELVHISTRSPTNRPQNAHLFLGRQIRPCGVTPDLGNPRHAEPWETVPHLDGAVCDLLHMGRASSPLKPSPHQVKSSEVGVQPDARVMHRRIALGTFALAD